MHTSELLSGCVRQEQALFTNFWFMKPQATFQTGRQVSEAGCFPPSVKSKLKYVAKT